MHWTVDADHFMLVMLIMRPSCREVYNNEERTFEGQQKEIKIHLKVTQHESETVTSCQNVHFHARVGRISGLYLLQHHPSLLSQLINGRLQPLVPELHNLTGHQLLISFNLFELSTPYRLISVKFPPQQ